MRVIAVVLAVAGRPSLWSTAARQAYRLVPRRWWARRPFLPVPDRDYVRFRAVTMYGDPDHAVEPDDVVVWLAWCRGFERERRARAATLTMQ